MEHDIYTDPRHSYLQRLARELDKRCMALCTPESIYDWLKASIEKVAPEDTTSAIMEWPASFDIYDREIERRIELSQLPEDQRKLFNWPWQSWNLSLIHI